MAEANVTILPEISADEMVLRIYEIGYHVSPATKEEEVEGVVAQVRSMIEKAEGRFLAEGAPSLIKLAYPIMGKAGGKASESDRGYFGWIKFEAPIAAAQILQEWLDSNQNILRSIVFQTVREETRARFKTAVLRDVKRSDILKAAPRQAEETSAPISDAELEKAISDITSE
jgi:ribosomal protein S6